MQVDIHYDQVELEKAIAAHVQRKLKLALSQMDVEISTISVYLCSVPSANEHSDKHCLLKISIAGLSDIVIKDTQADLYYVIDRVIQKASRVIARKFVVK